MSGELMDVSEQGVAFISRWEGCLLEAYLDIAGVWTIGFGHIAGFKDGRFNAQSVISKEDALALLHEDLKDAVVAVNKLIVVPMLQWEFDALVSFTFNVGAGALKQSTARQRINLGNKKGGADALTWWNKADLDKDGKTEPHEISKGLENRRRAEMRLFLTGQYGEVNAGG